MNRRSGLASAALACFGTGLDENDIAVRPFSLISHKAALIAPAPLPAFSIGRRYGADTVIAAENLSVQTGTIEPRFFHSAMK